MRPVGAFLGLVMMVAVGAWYAWPVAPLQWGFIVGGLLIDALLIWAYFASPPMPKTERP